MAALDAEGLVQIVKTYDEETQQEQYFVVDPSGDFTPFTVLGNQGSNAEEFTFVETITNHAPVAVAE